VGGEARRPPPESSKAYDRERLFPIVTRNAGYPSIFALSSFSLITRHMYKTLCMQPLTHIHTSTQARERDASRAVALNYRPRCNLNAINYLQRSSSPIKYSTLDERVLALPRNYSGPVFANSSTEVQTRRYFRELLMALGKAGASRGRGTCRDEGKISPPWLDPRENRYDSETRYRPSLGNVV